MWIPRKPGTGRSGDRAFWAKGTARLRILRQKQTWGVQGVERFRLTRAWEMERMV